jgi:hypothetical protein
MVDFIEHLKIHYAGINDEKVKAVIESTGNLIKYYDKHGWPKQEKEGE